MSSFPNVSPNSPHNRKNPLAAHGIFSPNSNLLARPTSTKVHKQQNSANFYAYKPNQPPPWQDHTDSKRRDVSPIGHNPREEKNVIAAQYNFNNIVARRRDSAGHNNARADRSPNQTRISRDISPLGRMNMQNEGVDFPPRAIRIENRDRKQGERDNSWHKLMNRPQEQALVKNQKLFEWRRVLDDQLVERKMKKHVEEEKKRIEDAEAEERFQRQIEELSSEIHQRKKILHKNGILRQQSNVLPLTNTSSLDQVDLKPVNVNSKSHKDVRDKRANREDISPVHSPSPMYNYVKERRGKSNNRDESSRHIDYSGEKREKREKREKPQPQNDHLNQYIDDLKAEIIQGQELFKNHMKDLKDEAYKLGKFRNLAERNLQGAQRIGFVKGGVAKLYHRDLYDDLPIVDSPTSKQRKIKLKVQEEEKFKWDNDDFFTKMPVIKKEKQMLLGVQMMVKIEPISEQLLAYKKPKSPQKKWFEDDDNKETENNKNINKEKKRDDNDKLKTGVVKKIDTDMTLRDLRDNKLQALSPKKTEESKKPTPNTTSGFEIKSTPKPNETIVAEQVEKKLQKQDSQKEILPKLNIQTRTVTPKNEEKDIPEDDLQLVKNFQPISAMLKGTDVSHARDITPSLEQETKRSHKPEQLPVEKLIQQETIVLDTKEMVTEKDVAKEKPKVNGKERKNSDAKNRQQQSLNNLGLKSDVALKALSKFVSKDGLEAKIAADKKLQSDPLARLDYMIDYLFNYNP